MNLFEKIAGALLTSGTKAAAKAAASVLEDAEDGIKAALKDVQALAEAPKKVDVEIVKKEEKL